MTINQAQENDNYIEWHVTEIRDPKHRRDIYLILFCQFISLWVVIRCLYKGVMWQPTFLFTLVGCPTGFTPDSVNGLCYLVLPVMDYQDSAMTTCYDTYDADLLVFDKDSDVQEFLKLLKSGESHDSFSPTVISIRLLHKPRFTEKL